MSALLRAAMGQLAWHAVSQQQNLHPALAAWLETLYSIADYHFNVAIPALVI